MAVYFLSEINKRSRNEDSFCDIEFRVNHEAAVHVMTVADGMGGLAGGKKYSSEAVRLFNERLLNLIIGEEFKDSSLERQMELLDDFCSQIFQQINQELYMNGLNAGMKGGTTLTAALHFWDSWIICNCGDSPAYRMKDGQLTLTSEIQNAAWKMVKEGKTREGSVLFYQNKTRLLQYLGRREQVSPYITRFSDKEMDGLLIGTDGAFGDLNQSEIAEVFRDNAGQQDLLSRLFDLARERGEEDNQTAVFYMTSETENVSQVRNKEAEDPDEEAVPGIYVELREEKKSLSERLKSYWPLGGRK